MTSPGAMAAKVSNAQGSPGGAAEAYLQAIGRGDWGLACALMTPAERRRMSDPGGCAAAVADEGPGLVYRAQLHSITAAGDTAVATLSVAGTPVGESQGRIVELQRGPRGWRVSDSGLD